MTELYTSEMTGSGQYGICESCSKPPNELGHDGCIGTLKDNNIMNACCGHGDDSQAYVQRWTKRKLIGQEAINYINENKV